MKGVNNLELLKFCRHKKTTRRFIKKIYARRKAIFSFRNAGVSISKFAAGLFNLSLQFRD